MMSDRGTRNGSGEKIPVDPSTVIKLPVNQGFEVTEVKLCVGHCWCTFQILGGGGVAGSEDFACATLPTTPLDFQSKI